MAETNEKVSNVVYALIGAGYTLMRVASLLPKEKVVLVVRSEESAVRLRPHFSNVRVVDVTDALEVKGFFLEYDRIKVLVDGVPPLHGHQDPLIGIRHLLQYLPSSLDRIVYISTTGVFGGSEGQRVNEDTECLPVHSNGLARLQSEQLYRATHCKKTVLRVPAIYGPGRGTGISLKKSVYPYLDNGSRWSNRIHVQDLAQIISKVVTWVGELPEVLCASDDCPAKVQEIVQYYCSRFGYSMPRSITEQEAISRGMQSVLSNQRVSNQLLKELLGYTFKYPSYKEGAGTEFEVDSRWE
jgi:nucleoside-diphosphate-sugar epimerase